MLLAVFQVQRKRIVNRWAGVSIGESGLLAEEIYQRSAVVSAKTASGTAIRITEGTLRIDHYDDNYLTLPPVRAANKERTSLTDSGLGFHHLVGPLQEQYSDQIFAIGGPG